MTVRRFLSLWLLLPPLLASAGQAPPFLETRVEPAAPYVQQQVRLTLRLFRGSHLQQGDFVLPEIPGALLAFVDETEARPVTRDGRSLEQVEQHYLLFPQHSGILQLPAPRFSGRGLFVRGSETPLRVRPPPPAAPRPWLPAAGLSLSLHWARDPAGWRAGEPRLLTLRVRARGLTGAQLPVPAYPPVDGLTMQEAGNGASEQIADGWVTGTRESRLRLIPERAGTYRLPPLSLTWWNTAADGPVVSRLPAVTLRVLPPLIPPSGGADTTPSPVQAPPEPVPGLAWKDLLPWLAALLFAGLALAAGRRLLPTAMTALGRWRDCRRSVRRFRRACLADDPAAARSALLDWSEDSGPGSRGTLPALADRFPGARAKAALLELDRALYGAGDWDGRESLERLLPHLHCPVMGAVQRPAADPIPPLNP